MKRILRVDVCDYTNTILCNIYDNQSDVSGEAVNVRVTTERNGWKELTFTIPTTCITENGEEENFRLDFLKADYRLQVIDDQEVDYYLIVEPKITHEGESKDVDVRAGHCSQLLKSKNLNLEFSDDEGNNTGTAKQILDEILNGTSWQTGTVFPFAEKDGTPKIRSFDSPSKTGAFAMISSLCELFDAVPIYHGATRTVDLIPLNPFANVVEGEIPEEVLINGRKVYELHYDTNIHNLEKTTNTENITTRLYVQGAYGDNVSKYCGVDVCMHDEYTYTVDSVREEYGFSDKDGVNRFFKADDLSVGDTVVFSTLDFTSRLYVWSNHEKAYHVYNSPTSQHEYDDQGKVINSGLTLSSQEEVENFFGFLTDFTYYDEIGLLTDDMLQQVAAYQRNMPYYYEISRNASLQMSESAGELSLLGESNSGFCKLDIRDSDIVDDPTLGERFTKIYLNATLQHPDGVFYRSDYLEKEDKYFSFSVAKKLKSNGDSVDNNGSVVYIIHTDGTWEYVFVKCIYDSVGNIYLNEEGAPRNYSYALEDDYPSAFGLWSSSVRVNPSDKVYLLCTNSMSGTLGATSLTLESLKLELNNITKQQTEDHPVYFEEYNGSTPIQSRSDILTGYGWCYQYFRTDTEGILYFCWGARGDTGWHLVNIGDDFPQGNHNDEYFYHARKKLLYRYIGNEWYKYETRNEKELARIFGIVINRCRKYDMIHRGYHERYSYNAVDPLPKGNYAFQSEFDFYWIFTTDMEVIGRMYLDTHQNYVYQTENVDSVLRPATQPFDTCNYPVENELEEKDFTQGILNINTGIEESAEGYYRSSDIILCEGQTYEYSLPEGSRIFFYDDATFYIGYYNLSGTGTFVPMTTPGSEKTMRYGTKARVMLRTTSSPIAQEIAEVQGNLLVKLNALRDATGSQADALQAEISVLYDRLNELQEQQKNSKWAYGPNVWIRIQDYDKKFFVTNKTYKILPSMPEGIRKGLNYYVPKFGEVADRTYIDYLSALQNAQNNISQQDALFTDSLGDILREGYWQDTSYVEGDETRLYDDAMDNLKEIARPEITYSFSFLDLRETQYLTEEDATDWPEIDITDAIHLVDPYTNVNCWGYVDKISKCFDKPWETTIEINTKLSTINQHSFTDVITRIANVARQTKARQPIYARAAALNADGTFNAINLEGVLNLHKTALLGGSSNWYTDDKNNIVFESSDGTSAMILSGNGFGIANSKTVDGDWDWKIFGTGLGFAAEQITAGILNAERIGANSISVDKLSSNVGQELNISSNRALALYATADGYRPAGALKTTDSLIEINAGRIEGEGQSVSFVPASINVKTGGNLNLEGGNIHMLSHGELVVESSAKFFLRAGKDSLNSTSDGLYIGTDGLNIYDIFKANWSGNSGSVVLDAENITIGKPNNVEQNMLEAFSGTFYCPATGNDGILKQDYYVGDTWMCTQNTTETIGSKTYTFKPGYEYICARVSSPKSYDDWIFVKTGNVLGTALSIDTNLGTIDITAANTINIGSSGTIQIKASQTLKLLSGGYVQIGNDGNAFTVGSVNSGNDKRAFIRKGKTSISDTATEGIYLGTDGILVGKSSTQYFKATAAGTVEMTGKITAQSGAIGNFTIDSALHSYGKSSIDEDVEGVYIGTDGIGLGKAETYSDDKKRSRIKLMSNGTLYARGAYIEGNIRSSSGQIGNFTLGTSLYSGGKNSIDLNVSGIYLGSDGIGLGPHVSLTNKRSKFKVTNEGCLYSTYGEIGGWTIKDTTLTGNKTGLAKTTNDTDVAIWAGNTTASSAAFRVTQGGALTATSFTIGDPNGTGVYIDSDEISVKSGGTVDFSAAKKISFKTGSINSDALQGDGFYEHVSGINITDQGVDITGLHINMDSNGSYVHIEPAGITMSGHVKIYQREIPNIVVVSNAEEESNVMADMANQNNWVLIRPYYASYVQAQGEGSTDQRIPLLFISPESTMGNGAYTYTYKVEVSLEVADTTSDTTSGGCRISNSNSYMYVDVPISGPALQYGAKLWTGEVTTGAQGSTEPNAKNLCNGGFLRAEVTTGSSAAFIVRYVRITCSTNTGATRIPCTVYYFP